MGRTTVVMMSRNKNLPKERGELEKKDESETTGSRNGSSKKNANEGLRSKLVDRRDREVRD